MHSTIVGRWVRGGRARFGVILMLLAAGISLGMPTTGHGVTAADARSAAPTKPTDGLSAPSARRQHWQPLPAAAGAFVPFELVIERIGVQARVVAKGVDSHNVMESPDHPFDVAWYRFTGKPGSRGNAVFSGHRDYSGVGPAIFWHLSELTAGDVIDVVSDLRTEARYEVTRTSTYALSSIPMGLILAPTGDDEITLITCSGAFTRGTYDHRLIVRAKRTA